MFPEGRALEFLIAAIVALVVVGPKDLPMLLRKLGQFMARVRAMASEFRASFDEMARQSELDELRKEVEAMRKAQLSDIAALSGAPEMTQTFDQLSQGLTDVGVDLNQATAYPHNLTQTETVELAEAPKPKRPRKATDSKPTPARAKAPPRKVAANGGSAKAAAKKPAPKAAAKPPAKRAAANSAKPRARKAAAT